jgi:hypothetical protein
MVRQTFLRAGHWDQEQVKLAPVMILGCLVVVWRAVMFREPFLGHCLLQLGAVKQRGKLLPALHRRLTQEVIAQAAQILSQG